MDLLITVVPLLLSGKLRSTTHSLSLSTVVSPPRSLPQTSGWVREGESTCIQVATLPKKLYFGARLVSYSILRVDFIHRLYIMGIVF